MIAISHPKASHLRPLQTIKFEFASMTTRCVIQLVHHNEAHMNAVAQRIYDNTKRLEATYNFFDPDSWLTKVLNQRDTDTVVLSKQTYDIFTQIRLLSELTQGVFDVTVGTLRVPPALRTSTTDKRILRLQQAYANGQTREQLQQKLQPAMGIQAWLLHQGRTKDGDNQFSIHCHHHDTRFDLGGVVKEFAVDEAIRIAHEANCTGLISFGGDLRVLGKKPNGKNYQVGIKNPFNPQQTSLSVPLNDEALTTSGNYERSEQVGTEQRSHLISSTTRIDTINRSLDTNLDIDLNTNLDTDHDRTGIQASIILQPASVTVISPTVLMSGVFSTALMLRPDLPLPSIQEAGGIIKVIIIDAKAKLHARSNEP